MEYLLHLFYLDIQNHPIFRGDFLTNLKLFLILLLFLLILIYLYLFLFNTKIIKHTTNEQISDAILEYQIPSIPQIADSKKMNPTWNKTVLVKETTADNVPLFRAVKNDDV